MKFSLAKLVKSLIDIIIGSPSSMLFIILGLIFSIAMIINVKKNKTIGKTLYLLGWLFIISFIIIKYNNYLSKIFDNLINNIFMQIFFPNIATYAIIIVLTNIIFLYTIFNKKSTITSKLINTPFFIIIMTLMVYTIELVSKKKINIYVQKQVYANEKIVTIIQSTTLIFTLWIIILLSKYILIKLIKKSDEKVRNEYIIPNNEKNNTKIPEIKIKKPREITQPSPSPIAIINPINPVNPAPNMVIPITTPNQIYNTSSTPIKMDNTTTTFTQKSAIQKNNTSTITKQIPNTNTVPINNNQVFSTTPTFATVPTKINNTNAVPIKINNNPVFSTAPTFATVPTKINNTNAVPIKINNINPVPSTAPTILPNTKAIPINTPDSINPTAKQIAPTINKIPNEKAISVKTNNTIPINTPKNINPSTNQPVPVINNMLNEKTTSVKTNSTTMNNQTNIFNTVPNQTINKQQPEKIEQLKI